MLTLESLNWRFLSHKHNDDYVKKSGDTMTGDLTASGNTTANIILGGVGSSTQVTATNPAIRRGVNGEINLDSIDDLTLNAIKGTSTGVITLDADGSIILMIDKNQDSTDRKILMRSNASTTDLWLMTEAGRVVHKPTGTTSTAAYALNTDINDLVAGDAATRYGILSWHNYNSNYNLTEDIDALSSLKFITEITATVSSATIAAAVGSGGYVWMKGAGTITRAVGSQALILSNAGTIDTAACFSSGTAGLNAISGGTVTNYIHYEVKQPIVASGTLTNQYGLKIPNMTAASGLNYAISTEGGIIVLNDTKTSTGDPTGYEGRIYINTVDNVIKMYADGAWRTLASGW